MLFYKYQNQLKIKNNINNILIAVNSIPVFINLCCLLYLKSYRGAVNLCIKLKEVFFWLWQKFVQLSSFVLAGWYLVFLFFFVYVFSEDVLCSNYLNNLAWNFETPLTPTMVGIISMHDYIMLLLGIILITKLLFFSISLYTSYLSDNKEYYNYTAVQEKVISKFIVFTHAPLLEWVWTVVPALLLLFFALPSFVLLYSLDEMPPAMYTISVIGNQWYWSYEYNDFNFKFFLQDLVGVSFGWNNSFKTELNYLLISPCAFSFLFVNDGGEVVLNNINFFKIVSKDKFFDISEYSNFPLIYGFDSLLVPEEQLPEGYPRLLTTDQVLVLPSETFLRFLITSADVIHSWTIPNFGIKVDAVPGRLNQLNFITNFCGTSWGQCSELCGINHGFMPIEVRVVPPSVFVYFLEVMMLKLLGFVAVFIKK